jgi:hypothetical protein
VRTAGCANVKAGTFSSCDNSAWGGGQGMHEGRGVLGQQGPYKRCCHCLGPLRAARAVGETAAVPAALDSGRGLILGITVTLA